MTGLYMRRKGACAYGVLRRERRGADPMRQFHCADGQSTTPDASRLEAVKVRSGVRDTTLAYITAWGASHMRDVLQNTCVQGMTQRSSLVDPEPQRGEPLAKTFMIGTLGPGRDQGYP